MYEHDKCEAEREWHDIILFAFQYEAFCILYSLGKCIERMGKAQKERKHAVSMSRTTKTEIIYGVLRDYILYVNTAKSHFLWPALVLCMCVSIVCVCVFLGASLVSVDRFPECVTHADQDYESLCHIIILVQGIKFNNFMNMPI